MAKPIIDILLVVADSANETEYATALEEAGYQLHIREPCWHEHRMFLWTSDYIPKRSPLATENQTVAWA
jgi:GrpB-like predicted nucleotidyltransferase (UPF0157 family)